MYIYISSHVCGSVCMYVHICMVVKEFIYTSYICIYVYIICIYTSHLIYVDTYACMYTYIYGSQRAPVSKQFCMYYILSCTHDIMNT